MIGGRIGGKKKEKEKKNAEAGRYRAFIFLFF